jgi:hypothetical protein
VRCIFYKEPPKRNNTGFFCKTGLHPGQTRCILFLAECFPTAAMGEATGRPAATATGGRSATVTAGTGATETREPAATAMGGPAVSATGGPAASATGEPAASAATASIRDGEEMTPDDSGPRLRLDWQEAPMHGECLPSPKARVPAAIATHGWICLPL